jgi:hypothetical protein
MEGALWSAELALAWTDLLANTTRRSPPDRSQCCNFSRVERQGRTNWDWQPQGPLGCQPSPTARSLFVDMHMPDAWGYLILQQQQQQRDNNDDSSSTTFDSTTTIHDERDALWPAKLTATTIYYGLCAYSDQRGVYTTDLSALTVPSEIIEPFRQRSGRFRTEKRPTDRPTAWGIP